MVVLIAIVGFPTTPLGPATPPPDGLENHSQDQFAVPLEPAVRMNSFAVSFQGWKLGAAVVPLEVDLRQLELSKSSSTFRRGDGTWAAPSGGVGSWKDLKKTPRNQIKSSNRTVWQGGKAAGRLSRVVDEGFIRQAIVNPNSVLLPNYPPIMPTFQGQVDEEQVLQLIAYMKSLGTQERTPSK